MLAQVCGYQPGTLVHIVNNLHIYDRHIPAVKAMLENEGFAAPKVILDPSITDFYQFTKDSFKEVMENPEYPGPQLKLNPEVKDFYDFTEDDFELVGYESTKLATKFQVAE